MRNWVTVEETTETLPPIIFGLLCQPVVQMLQCCSHLGIIKSIVHENIILLKAKDFDCEKHLNTCMKNKCLNRPQMPPLLAFVI